MIYASMDSDDGHIAENAYIQAFDTVEEARAWLSSPFDRDGGWDVATLQIGEGRYHDCWVSTHTEPDLKQHYFAPFTPDQLRVQRPGQHPGGKAWWIEPSEEVLVVTHIKPLDDDEDDK